MNRELNEIIILLKDIKQLLKSNDSSLIKNNGPVRTKAANRPKYK